MSRLDIDTLISCVLSRPAIWDKRERSHSNRTVVDRCWKEIAKDMRTDECSLRKKWKYLREQFCVELGKLFQPHGDEASQPEATKWPHFKALLFLKDVVKPRLSMASTNNSFMTVPVDPVDYADDGDEPSEDHVDEFPINDKRIKQEPVLVNFETALLNSHIPPSLDDPASVPTPRKRYCPSENESVSEIEKEKLNLFKLTHHSVEDEDWLFFRSLLPHVRNIKPKQKLLMRRKILEVVSGLAYPPIRAGPSSRNHWSQSEDFNHTRRICRPSDSE